MHARECVYERCGEGEIRSQLEQRHRSFPQVGLWHYSAWPPTLQEIPPLRQRWSLPEACLCLLILCLQHLKELWPSCSRCTWALQALCPPLHPPPTTYLKPKYLQFHEHRPTLHSCPLSLWSPSFLVCLSESYLSFKPAHESLCPGRRIPLLPEPHLHDRHATLNSSYPVNCFP